MLWHFLINSHIRALPENVIFYYFKINFHKERKDKMSNGVIQSIATPGDGSGVVQPCDVAVCADGSYVLTDSQRIIRVHPPQTRWKQSKYRQQKESRQPGQGWAQPKQHAHVATQWLVAGASGTPGRTDGIGHAARFNSPFGLAIAADGAGIIVADTQNHSIRIIRDFQLKATEFSGYLPLAYGGSAPTEQGSYWGSSGAARAAASAAGGGGVDQQHAVPKVATLAGGGSCKNQHDENVHADGANDRSVYAKDADAGRAEEGYLGSNPVADGGPRTVDHDRYSDVSYDEDYYNEDEYFEGDSYGSDSVFDSPNTSFESIPAQIASFLDGGASAAASQFAGNTRTHARNSLEGAVVHPNYSSSSDDELPPDPIAVACVPSAGPCTAAGATDRAGSITPTPHTSSTPASSSRPTGTLPSSPTATAPGCPPNHLYSIVAVKPEPRRTLPAKGKPAADALLSKSSFSPSPTSSASRLAASKFKGRAALFPLGPMDEDGGADDAAPNPGHPHAKETPPPQLPTLRHGAAGAKPMKEVLLLPDGPARHAEFNGPLGIAVHPDGTVVVTESWRHAVRSVKDGVVRTLAGSHSSSGYVNSAKGDYARFFGLLGIAALPGGGCAVADRDNCCVRAISATGSVTTLAGSGEQGNADGKTRMDATFSIPSSIAADVAGRIVVADNAANWSSASLRIIDPHSNTVRTLALRSAGSGNAAVLSVDTKVAIDAQGNIVCANSSGVHRVTNTGLAPGYSAWWRPIFWKKPRRKLGRLLGSASACSPTAGAALNAVFLVAARLNSAPNADTAAAALEQQRSGELLPALPDKLWHHILGMLQPWQIGSIIACL